MQRDLYGGAAHITLPKRFEDVRYHLVQLLISVIRSVPDYQEVFVDVNTDECFIVELLSMEDSV